MRQTFTAEPAIPVRNPAPLWLRVAQWSFFCAVLAGMSLYEASGCPAAQMSDAEASHLTILAADSHGKAEFCAYKHAFSRTNSELYDGPVAGTCAATRGEVDARIKDYQKGQADQFHSCLVSNPLLHKIRQYF
ncbi:hypothetical protein AB4Y45_33800 [Paraburkholderia sp. EG287A]|uniref:hypothetical protein n=1 Tax=Paraburkholderia sp. EG287A TaxID=3237012 RepID=UPI0034D2DBE2